MEDTTTSAAVTELVVIRWAVPTVAEHSQVVVRMEAGHSQLVDRMEAEHFQVVVPTVEERSHVGDHTAGAASPLTRDASFVRERSMWSRDSARGTGFHSNPIWIVGTALLIT